MKNVNFKRLMDSRRVKDSEDEPDEYINDFKEWVNTEFPEVDE